MKNINSFYSLASVCVASLLLFSCSQAGGEQPGSEFMPDMAHSVAYEANYNTYYYNNTWGSEEEYEKMAGPRKPVNGTVARGHIPYAYKNLEQFRESSNESFTELQTKAAEVALKDATLVNSINPTNKEDLEKVLVHGKELYTVACAVCHGKKGDGNGSIYNAGNGPYSAAPANYLTDDLINASDARYYNAIMNGKGQMQSHADKLNEEERWKVIHYIRSLQADKKGLDYFEQMGATASKNLTLKEAFAKMMEENEKAVAASLETTTNANDSAATASPAQGKAMAVKLDNVLYSTGLAVLKQTSYQTLQELLEILNMYPSIKIEIGGHTDNIGQPNTNMQLSEDRARSVFNYLVSEGIAKDRLSFRGYGESSPIATNNSEAGRRQNRRTEVKIVK